MKKKIFLSIAVLLLIMSCKDSAKAKVDSFDVIKEKKIIDDLVNNKKLEIYHYVKLYNQKELQVYNSSHHYDFNQESDGSVENDIFVYCVNRRNIKCIAIFLDGEDISETKKYYFINNKTFAIEYSTINLSNPQSFEENYTQFFDSNFNKTSETFETKDENNKVTSNEKITIPKLKNYKNIDEIVSDIGLQEEFKKEASKPLSNNEKSIDNEYIDYLKEYEASKVGSSDVITFQKTGKNVYWITTFYGSGMKQETYWKNNNNLLVPCYTFEYGGMDWDAPLEYYFEDINTGIKKEGTATEAEINQLKEKFIEQSENN